MKPSTIVLAIFASLAVALPSWAVLPSSCPTEYAGNVAPDLRNAKLAENLREVCYSQFGVFHSGVTATPLFVGQKLTASLVARAKRIDRNDAFRPEQSLPKAERAELSHYRGSGLDRGHMAPAADMASDAANDESFSLANMVPQYPALNRGAWADIEETTRRLASQYGEVFVVTGPSFSGGKLSRIGGRVLVPSAVFKAIYIPKTGQSSAWWADNHASGGMEVISIAKLSERIGADVFPAVAARSKATAVSLPLPKGVIAPAKSPDVAISTKPLSLEIPAVNVEIPPAQTWIGWIVAILADLVEALIRAMLRG